MREFKKYALLYDGSIVNMYWDEFDGTVTERETEMRDGILYVIHDEPFPVGDSVGFALHEDAMCAQSDDYEELEELRKSMRFPK